MIIPYDPHRIFILKTKEVNPISLSLRHILPKLLTVIIYTTIRKYLLSSGLYYKHTTIVNYTSSIINKLEALLIDNTTVIIYNHHVFIVQATGYV